MRPSLRTGGIVLATATAAALWLSTMGGVLRAGVGALIADRVLGQIDFIKTAVNFVDAIGMHAPGTTIAYSSTMRHSARIARRRW